MAFALHRMGVGHYRHVPITDAQARPTAIISVRDVLRYLTEKLAEADASSTAPISSLSHARQSCV